MTTVGSGWLLAPMELSALVVGVDAADGDYVWNDLSPNFSKIYNDLAYSGPQLVTLFPQAGTTPAPGGGIHLHWLLPQAFGRGVETAKGGLEYRHIPNRWLVRRIRYAPGTSTIVDTAAWMIESDFLHDISQTQSVPGTINFLHDASPALFASVGQATRLDKYSQSQTNYRLTLTALGPGSPDFASSYPACKSVLGFHDADPSDGADGDCEVSYQVMGWCSDPCEDLLAGVDEKTLTKRLDELELEISETGKVLGVMDRVLCHGAASRVLWNREDLHVSSVPTSDATVCVGNSSGEALATMLAPMMQGTFGDPAELEPFLTAFHYDMLGSDQSLQDVEAELHRQRYTSRAGPDRFSIAAQRKPVARLPSAGAPDTAEPPRPVQSLPPEIALALKALNAQARAVHAADTALARARQDLFSLWCQWAGKYYATRQAPVDLGQQVTRARALVDSAAKLALGARSDLADDRAALETTLSTQLPDLELSQSTEDPFYHPADPALVITGKGFEPRNVYNKYSHPDKLPCRHGGELIDGVSAILPNQAARSTVRLSDLFPLTGMTATPSLENAPYKDLLDGILRETLLLDPVDPRKAADVPLSAAPVVAALLKKLDFVPSEAAVKQMTSDIEGLLTGAAKPTETSPAFSALTDTAPAMRPAALGLARWLGNPWRPVFLTWQVDWYPQSGLGGAGDLASDWTSWGLDDSGNEFALPDNLTFDPTPSQYEGYAMLAPNAAWVLRRRLEKLIAAKANTKLSQIVSAIDDLPALAQSLSGFHEGLTQLAPGLQLPPINPAFVLRGTGDKADAVAQDINGVAALDPQYMHAPDLGDTAAPRNPFQPIRGGALRFKRLAVVDSFGQMRVLADPSGAKAQVVSSFGLPQTADARAQDMIVLPPRYAQPARLDFQWLPSDARKPGSSPLCGWVFSNHLDQSLMICGAKGQLLGAVQKVIRAPNSGGSSTNSAFFWVPVPGSDTPADAIQDPEMKRFVGKLLQLGTDAGEDFLASLEAAQAGQDSAVQQDARLSLLVGQPLALVRAELAIELEGDPLREISAPLPPKSGTDNATRGVTQVTFPLRLGGQALAAGGLAGFLLEGDDTYYPRFGLTGRDFPGALVHGKQLQLNAESPLAVTLLMDPHAPVYARSGVLPRHKLTLPEDVAAGLSSIRDVFFQSAPLLGPPGAPRVPSPSDDYGQWSWAVRPQVTHWTEYPEINDPGDRGGFGQKPLELQEGWLKLVMNPVSISAFWVKEGATKVDAGTRVTLGWMVEGAQTLILSADGTPDPIATFSAEGDAQLPLELKYDVVKPVKLTLTASDARGNRSVKTLSFDVE